MEDDRKTLLIIRDKLVHNVALTADEFEFLAHVTKLSREAFVKAYKVEIPDTTLIYLFAKIGRHSMEKPSKEAFAKVKLLSYLLSPRVRRELFEPSFNDVKADFVKARRRYTSNGERRWLAFCFGLHTSIVVGQCFWAMLGDKAKRILFKLAPEFLRRWWGGIS